MNKELFKIGLMLSGFIFLLSLVPLAISITEFLGSDQRLAWAALLDVIIINLAAIFVFLDTLRYRK